MTALRRDIYRLYEMQDKIMNGECECDCDFKENLIEEPYSLGWQRCAELYFPVAKELERILNYGIDAEIMGEARDKLNAIDSFKRDYENMVSES